MKHMTETVSSVLGTPEEWTNPLRDPRDLRLPRIAGPCSIVIFGVTGDLSRKKLLPAIYDLANRGLLPPSFGLTGFARRDWTEDHFKDFVKENVQAHCRTPFKEATWTQLADGIRFVQGTFDDPKAFERLSNTVAELDRDRGTRGNHAFYMSVPPRAVPQVSRQLADCGLAKSDKGAWRRVIIEKPFGHDLASAKELDRVVSEVFDPSSVFRIDHYLGKETVQNILALRFANAMYEPIWNNNYVDHVQITMAEDIGVAGRAGYYDGIGAARDIIQNHLLQLMAFVAMEPPAVFEPEPIRNEIVKVFRAIRRYTPAEIGRNVLRAQYTGCEIDGQYVPGYREEKNVAPDSTTETFVAMKLFIDNWRWGGVPFLFHTGKRLSKKQSEVVIHFKSTPTQLFSGQCSGRSCNKLTLRIQPDESISLKFGLKMPGAGLSVRQVSMDFRYDSLSSDYLPDAYERLLLDVMLGDSTLYARRDSLEASWQFIDPILRAWKQNPQRSLLTYPALTEGPDPQQLLEVGNDRPDENCTLDESIFQE